MKYSNEDGSTIVEFLSFTPIMVLIAFYATKISHEEKMKKRNLLTGRNMIFQGKSVIENMIDPVHHLSVFKKRGINLADSHSLQANIREGLSEDHKIGDNERLRIESTTLKTTLEKSNPEFLQYSDKINTFNSALVKGYEKNKVLESSPLFFNAMKVRKSELRLKRNGEADGFKKSINHIQDFYAGHDKADNLLPDMVKEFYFRGDDLYHNKEGHKIVVPAIQIVTGSDKWASSDDPTLKQNYYQNYCQGKFTASYNSCGDTDYLLLQRPSFATKIHELAEAKIKLFDIFTNGEIAPIHAQLASEWANQNAQFPTDWGKEETIIYNDLVQENGYLNPNDHINLDYLSENHFESSINKETFLNKIHQDIDPVHKHNQEVLYVE